MPKVLTPDDQQELKTLRDFFDPQKSADRLDGYGKWVFTAVASITALGAGLSNAALQNLDLHGKLIYGLAVVSGGISLASAALLLTPQLSNVNPWSMDLMRKAIDHTNKNRRVYVIVASWTLAIALVLASLAPLVTAYYTSRAAVPSEPEVQYSLAGNNLTVAISMSGLLPDSKIIAEVKRVEPAPEALLGRAVVPVSDKGAAKTTIEASLTSGGKIQINYTATSDNGAPKAGSQEFVCEIAPK